MINAQQKDAADSAPMAILDLASGPGEPATTLGDVFDSIMVLFKEAL